MTLLHFTALFGLLYAGLLIASLVISRRAGIETKEDFLLAGQSLGYFLGFITFSASLFSTFTLLGMPDFFRTHGIGAWIFLGVADVAMAFSVLWIGLNFRQAIKDQNITSISGFLLDKFGRRGALVYLIGIFLMLLPFVAIQIKGVSLFLDALMPSPVGSWLWAAGILLFILFYSALGGLRAIVFSDAIQGTIMLIAIWIAALICLNEVGGIEALFSNLSASRPDVLTLPGPNGLFTAQFLIASFIAIFLLPFGQPQLTLRLAIVRDDNQFRLMALAIGVFAFSIIIPTLLVGLYGALNYADFEANEFLTSVLIGNQPTALAAIIIVGLLAAAMSTADSMLFALGTEYSSLLQRTNLAANSRFVSRIVVLLFGAAAFLVAMLDTQGLVLLGRVSITGSALLSPLVISAIFMQRPPAEAPYISGGALIFYLASLYNLIGDNVFGIRLDLLLLSSLSIYLIVRCGLWRVFSFNRLTAHA
jgi:SSS family solute:Na+ symporter